MTTDSQRRASIQAATQFTNELGRLFGAMGTGEHPNGRVLVAYRNARRALESVYRNEPKALWRAATWEVLEDLKRNVRGEATAWATRAADIGRRQAEREAATWHLRPPTRAPARVTYVPAWLGELERQIAAAYAVVDTGADVGLIWGDAERAGILRPDPLVRDGARWLVMGAVAGWLDTIGQATESSEEVWYKQVVAAIDERTTDCCLQAHGQTVPMDAQFHLTGEPRFADDMDWVPFHWWCRSSVVILPADQVGDELTEQMQRAARMERDDRERTGTREEIHPAHGRSRRRIPGLGW